MPELVRGKLSSEALERVLGVVSKLSRPIDLDNMLAEVIDVALEVMGAERGTVFLYEQATDELCSRVATGDEIDVIRIKLGNGIAGHCAKQRQVVMVDDCYNDERFNPEVDQATGFRSRSLLSVPLVGIEDQLVGVLQLVNKRDGAFGANDLNLAIILGGQCALALERAMLIEAHIQKQKQDADLAVAREIQRRVLPAVMPEAPDYQLAGWSESAEETGGDIYDAVDLGGGKIVLLLGDATGHGIGPALSVTQVRAMLRIAVRLGADLGAVVAHINDQLAADLPTSRFVTAFIGILDTTTDTLIYHSGGQGPLIQYHYARDDFDVRDSSAIPLGIMRGVTLETPAPFDIAAGDIVALISDGVFECENHAGEFYGAPRVLELLRAHRDRDVGEMLASLRAELDSFAAGKPQPDDMTVVLVKRCHA